MVVRPDIRTAQARRFVSNGAAGDFDHVALAEACDRLIRLEIQRSPKAAIGLARKLISHARKHGGVLEQTALTVLGLALHASGRYQEARDALLETRGLLGRVPDKRARIDRILIDVYMYLGDIKQATRRYRLAASTFERLGDKVEVAKTRVNFANLLHRQDRHREAGRQYRLAIKLLKPTSEELSLAICYYNLANTQVQTIDFDGAAELYLEAERILTRLGYDLYANECRYGLAWLRMLHGDYHLALTGLADCEVHYERAGQKKGVLLCQLDRAEIYLALNLLTDARNASLAAEKQARKLGIRYEAGKAALFLAKASLAMGDRAAARRALGRARRGFKDEHNQAFLGVVDLTSALIQVGNSKRRTVLDRARRRFTKGQFPLWEAISDLECLALYPGDTDVRARLNRNRAVKVVPHLYARWQTLLGDRQLGLGRVTAARRHWMRAVEMLDNVRVQLPPAEVRSLLSRHGDDPYQRLVRSDCEQHPEEAAAWSERRRTGGAWSPLKVELIDDETRDRAQKSLSDLAQEFSLLSAKIDPDAGRRSTAVISRTRQLDTLQREVHRRLSHLERHLGGQTPSQQSILDKFRSASVERPILQFHCDAEGVIALAHSEGRTTVHRYTDGHRVLKQYADFWQFLVGRAVQAGRRSLQSDLEDERSLFAELGKWLCEPLTDFFAGDEVLILPEGELTNLPWQALVLNGRTLAETTSIVLAPSLRHYLHASEIEVASKNIEVFEGNTEGLSSCRSELAIFEADAGTTIHQACRRADWPNRSESLIWHYLGHAQYRSDNPFYSSLQMADGPMFAADFRLAQNRVGLVTLAACRTGQQTFVPGEESIGLVRSLLEMGARSVIASHWAVADKSTALWMSTFYGSYLLDHSLHKSIREAALTVRERYPSAYHWAAFSLFGAA